MVITLKDGRGLVALLSHTSQIRNPRWRPAVLALLTLEEYIQSLVSFEYLNVHWSGDSSMTLAM